MQQNPSQPHPSFLVRFLDSFLQERNIKWILLLGMGILLGSSLFLVNSHWQGCTPTWKYLIFQVYFVILFGAGEWTRHRLALPRTGTVLQALTVLLVPLSFLVLHWVREPGKAAGTGMMQLALVAGNTAFCAFAARRVFAQFLRETQWTFLVSFLLLSVAGVFVPTLPAASAPWVALATWAVFTIGSVKVNRHVFWLTEEQRAPRIFGFFPILLLGAQFLALFLLHPGQIGLAWLGLGCVLVALPVLLTADAVGYVFEQRTGDLVRPLPWAILGPLVLGVVLCVTGVCLAATEALPPAMPYALLPTCVLSAAMMGMLARRTKKQAFVWAMLGAVVLTYNFSPLLFRELAIKVLSRAAHAVHEQRLPLAFYGLTYLPLLSGMMLVSSALARRGHGLFAVPMRRLVIGLSLLLLGASLGHVKAFFPVSLCMTALLALQVRMFRDGRLALPAAAAWLIACGGFPMFAVGVLGWTLPAMAPLATLAIGGLGLLIVGVVCDERIAAMLPTTRERWLDRWASKMGAAFCQSISLGMALALAGCWCVRLCVVSLDGQTLLMAIPLGVLLFAHAVRWERPLLAGALLIVALATALAQAIGQQVGFGDLLACGTLLLIGLSLCGRMLRWRSGSRLSRTFEPASAWIGDVGLFLLAAGYYSLLAFQQIVVPFVSTSLIAGLPSLPIVPWICPLLMAAWAFDAARRSGEEAFAFAGMIAVFGAAADLVMRVGGADAWLWLPTLWSLLAFAALPFVGWMRRRIDEEPTHPLAIFERPLSAIIEWTFRLTAISSLLVFALPMRVAGGLGLAGMMLCGAWHGRPALRAATLLLINWHVFEVAVLMFGPPMDSLLGIANANPTKLSLPLAVVSALSLALWQTWRRMGTSVEAWAVRAHLVAVRLLGGVNLFLFLGFAFVEGWTALDALMMAVAFACAAWAEFATAVRDQRIERVWTAFAVVLLAALSFALLRVIPFGRGLMMFVLIGIALLAWVVGEWARQRGKLAILTAPLQQLALGLPLAVAVLGVLRHFAVEPVWKGANSLALLLAAGAYFWYGIEHASKRVLILAAAVLNVALLLLWRELHWNDPQFFMVPVGLSILGLVRILKNEIPAGLHTPLSYLGALVILVSPTFHIVGGSWVHLFCLMVFSVLVVLLSIGLRVRALVYTGTGFLIADLIAMVVRGSLDHPNLLWVAGLGLGTAVLALGAFCERHREQLLTRMRLLSEMLQAWD